MSARLEDDPAEDVCPVLAKFLTGEFAATVEVVSPHLLERKKLDWSLGSLSAVDDYLDALRELPSANTLEDTAAWDAAILRTAAYVGEVARRKRKDLRWFWYESWIAKVPDHLNLLGEKDASTFFLLGNDNRFVTLPINRILKFLRDGRTESTRSFVQALIEKRFG